MISFAITACGSESPRRSVRLTISTDVDVPTDVDRVEVVFTASRTSLGATCVPVREGWDLTSSGDLPIVVDFVPGDIYGSWLGLRVAWFKVGTPVDVREVIVPWPDDGIYPVDIRLERQCLAVGCSSDSQCIDGRCVAFPNPSPLDDLLIDPGAPSCDRDAQPSDGGIGEDGSGESEI